MELQCKKIEEGLKKLLFESQRSNDQEEHKKQASVKHPSSKYRQSYKPSKTNNQEYFEERATVSNEPDKKYPGHKRKPKYARESKQSYNTPLPDGHYRNMNEKHDDRLYSYAEEKKPIRYQRRGQNVVYNQKGSRRDSQSSFNQGENRNLKYSDAREYTDEDSLSQSKHENTSKQKVRYRSKKVKNQTDINGLIKLDEKKSDHSSDPSLKQTSDKKMLRKLLADAGEKECDNLSYSNVDTEVTKNTCSVNKSIVSMNYENSSHVPVDEDNVKRSLDKREKKKKRERKKDKNKIKDESCEFSLLKPQVTSNSKLQQQSPSQEQEIKDKEPPHKGHILDSDILGQFGNKEQEDLFRLEKEGFLISWKDTKIKFECKVCLYKCYELQVAVRHSNNREHQMKKQEQDFEAMLKVIPEPLSCQSESITELLYSIAEQYGLSVSEVEERKQLVKFLNENFRKYLSGCEFELVGSSISGFGLKTSEADIALVTPSESDSADLLASTYELIKKVHDFTEVCSEFTEKVPQIHFTVEATGLKCNITLNNNYSNLTSKLLSDYASIDHRVHVLGIAFRYWAKICEVDQRKMGTLAPFCYPFLLIHFLQQQNPSVLPVLHELQTGRSSDLDSYLDPKDLKGKWKCENHESVGNLWIKLFKFYTVLFKFGEDVVTVRHLKPVTIKDKKWGTKFLAIEDFPNSKRNLANSIPNRQLFSYLTGCFKATYNYFARPELTDGPLSFIQITVFQEENANSFNSDQSYPTTSINFSADNNNITDLNKLSEITMDFINTPCQEKNHLDENILSASPSGKEKLLLDAEKCENISEYLEETLEDQDPDLSINEVITTIKNISFDEMCPTDDTDKDDVADESCSNVEDEDIFNASVPIDSTSLETKSDKKNSNDNKDSLECPETNSENELLEIYMSKNTDNKFLSQLLPEFSATKILKYVWSMEDRCLCKEDMLYMFSKKTFTKGMTLPLVCRHCQKSGHLKQNCPDLKLPFICALPSMDPQFLHELDKTCQEIMCEYCPGQIEINTRNSVLKELEEAIQIYYPDAHLEMFGSYCNGFGFMNSDMDICLTFRNNATGEGLNHVEIIEDLAFRLKTHNKLFWDILPITSAKVPIVKFKYRSLDLEGDISLYNTLAQYNTLMLRTYCFIDPRVQLLGYTIKYFAKVLDICDASKGSLSSYAYILMVIFYLQQISPPVLPVLQELYEGEKPKIMIDGWNAWFYDDFRNISKVWNSQKNQQSIGDLWLGLLCFYTEEFDIQNYVISIRQKDPLLRFKKLWNTKEIAIEDPFDLSHNLGGGLSRKMNTYIMKAFIRGREVFGTPCPLNKQYPSYKKYLFNRDLLTRGELPPNDRGCRICRRIGHIMRDCPRRKPNKREQNEDEPRRRPPRFRKHEGLPSRDNIPPRQRRQTEPSSISDRSQIKNHSGTYSSTEAATNAPKSGLWSNPYNIQQHHKQLPVSLTNVQYGLSHSFPNSAQNHVQPFPLSALSMKNIPQQQSANQQQIWQQQQQQTGYSNIPPPHWNQQQSNTNLQVQQLFRRC